jgi:hypothetical protein
VGNTEQLMRSIRKGGFKIVKFMGDSMAVQLAHHIGCGLHRQNSSGMEYFGGAKHFYNMNTHACAHQLDEAGKKGVFLCVERAPVSVGAFNHSSKQFRLKRPLTCSDEPCHIQFALDYIAKSYDKVLNIGKKFKKTLFIMPLPVARKLNVEMEEYCKAIYRNAKMLKGRQIHILIMTPLTQHFDHPRGLFIKGKKKKTANQTISSSSSFAGLLKPEPKRSCKPLKGPFPLPEHPDSLLFRKYMDRLFPTWRNLIGFYDATKTTTPFWVSV